MTRRSNSRGLSPTEKRAQRAMKDASAMERKFQQAIDRLERRDDSLRSGGYRVVKESDESRTSTTSFAVDSELVISDLSTGLYMLEAWILFDAGITEDMKIRLTGTNASLLWNRDMDSQGAVTWASGASAIIIGGGVGVDLGFNIRGMVDVTSDPGSVSIDWAQNTGGPNATTVQRGSWFHLTPA